MPYQQLSFISSIFYNLRSDAIFVLQNDNNNMFNTRELLCYGNHTNLLDEIVHRKNSSTSSGFTIDMTSPSVKFLRDHPQGLKYLITDNTMYGHWQFLDPESSIKEYRSEQITTIHFKYYFLCSVIFFLSLISNNKHGTLFD